MRLWSCLNWRSQNILPFLLSSEHNVDFKLYFNDFLNYFRWEMALEPKKLLSNYDITCQFPGVHRWRPVSRKLSLTICQASSTIRSFVTTWDSLWANASTSSSSWQGSVKEASEVEVSEVDFGDGDSIASEDGEAIKRLSERAPVKRAVSALFCQQLQFLAVAVVWRMVGLWVGLKDGEGASSEDEALQSIILIFWRWRLSVIWLELQVQAFEGWEIRCRHREG